MNKKFRTNQRTWHSGLASCLVVTSLLCSTTLSQQLAPNPNWSTIYVDPYAYNDTWFDNYGDISIFNYGTLNNSDYLYNTGTLDNDGGLYNDILGTLNNSGTLNNRTGGTLNNLGYLYNAATFSNDGGLNNKTGGTLNNSGTFDNKTGGTLNNSGYLYNAATLNNAGGLNNDALSTLNNSGALNNKTGGTLNNSGYLYNPVTLNNYDGGTLNNSGTIDSSLGTFQNAGVFKGTGTFIGTLDTGTGTVAPGSSAGTMSVLGDYILQGTGVLDIEIGGFTPGLFDVLDISGTAYLGGGIIKFSLLDGYDIVTDVGPGETWELRFLHADVIDSFESVVSYDFIGLPSFQYNVFQREDDLIFQATNTVPLPGAVLLGMLGLSTAAWRLRKRRSE